MGQHPVLIRSTFQALKWNFSLPGCMLIGRVCNNVTHDSDSTHTDLYTHEYNHAHVQVHNTYYVCIYKF